MQVVSGSAGRINDLVAVTVTMRGLRRYEIPVRADLHSSNVFQMGSDQQHPDQYKGRCCYQWEINKRDTERFFPCRLLQKLRSDGYTLHDIIHSMALPGRHKCYAAAFYIISIHIKHNPLVSQ